MTVLPVEGLHDDIDETAYHSDWRSLSSTGAKTLLYQGPRAYRWAHDHPVHKDVFDFGSVVHALILGVGDFAVIDHDSWRTKAAQAEREAARVDGRAPILAKDYAAAIDMRDAVLENKLAASILAEGRPEVSMWATDPQTGVLMRGRIDWLRDNAFADVKTSAGQVDPLEYARTAWKLHYHFQAAYYQRILELNGIEDHPPLWVALSKTAPHEVYVHQPDADMLARGHADVDLALSTYAHCLATDTWPGLQDDQQIHTLSAPRWA